MACAPPATKTKPTTQSSEKAQTRIWHNSVDDFSQHIDFTKPTLLCQKCIHPSKKKMERFNNPFGNRPFILRRIILRTNHSTDHCPQLRLFRSVECQTLGRYLHNHTCIGIPSSTSSVLNVYFQKYVMKKNRDEQ